MKQLQAEIKWVDEGILYGTKDEIGNADEETKTVLYLQLADICEGYQ